MAPSRSASASGCSWHSRGREGQGRPCSSSRRRNGDARRESQWEPRCAARAQVTVLRLQLWGVGQLGVEGAVPWVRCGCTSAYPHGRAEGRTSSQDHTERIYPATATRAWAMGAPGNGRVLQLEARNKSLQAENKKLREASKGADAEAKEPARAGDSMEVDGDGVLDAAVSRARVHLKQLKDLPEAVRGLLAGGYEARLATAQAELEQANVARRAANPLKKQMDGAENHKARMAKKLEDAKSALQEREAAREAINAQIVERVAAVAEAEAANAKASAEVAAVAAKYASERTDPTRIVLDGEDAPPGFVSIQFADGKWAEREAVFAQQIAQLTALVAAQGEGSAAASEGSPSVADEDEDLEGDEAWSQVTRDKRRKVLRKERDVLASKVRSSLGKVSSHASPFNESRRIRK